MERCAGFQKRCSVFFPVNVFYSSECLFCIFFTPFTGFTFFNQMLCSSVIQGEGTHPVYRQSCSPSVCPVLTVRMPGAHCPYVRCLRPYARYLGDIYTDTGKWQCPFTLYRRWIGRLPKKVKQVKGVKANRNALFFSIFLIPEPSCTENVIIPGALLLLQRWHDLRPGRRVS